MLYHKGIGRHDKEHDKLWKKLVPKSGQSETVQGELVRVIGRLADEFYRNGNGNWDNNYRMFTFFLYKYLSDDTVFSASEIVQTEEDLEEIRRFGSGKDRVFIQGEDAIDRVTDRVVEWCKRKPELIKREINPKINR